MIVDIHKPDISTLVRRGHFYFGWTQAALGLTPLKRSHYTGAGLTPNTNATGDLNAAG